jgi:hypothetical protein
MVPSVEFTTARSSVPSPLKSAAAIPTGFSPQHKASRMTA